MQRLPLQDVQFRPYRELDFEEVSRLWTEINRELAPAHLQEAFDRYIDVSLNTELANASQVYQTEKRGVLSVVTQGDRVVGTFGIQPVSRDTVELRRMYLMSDFRGQGIAQKMLKTAEDSAAKAGFHTLILSTAEIQGAAVSFYKKSGFQLVDTRVEDQASNKSIGGGIVRHHFEKVLTKRREAQTNHGKNLNQTPAINPRFSLAALDDLEVVGSISRQAYEPAYLPLLGALPRPATEDYAPWIQDKLVWICYLDCTAAGVLVVEKHLEYWVVWSVAVRPNHQGMGLGRELIGFAKRLASESQIPYLLLHTNSKMKKNIRLYKELGFYQTETVRHPSRNGHELVYMQFDL